MWGGQEVTKNSHLMENDLKVGCVRLIPLHGRRFMRSTVHTLLWFQPFYSFVNQISVQLIIKLN